MTTSRRHFLLGTGSMLATLLLARKTLAQTPGRANRDRILVAYASKCGSTAEVAERIGAALRASGAEVEVMPVDKVRDPASYRAVVVGSAIRAGRWVGSATRFLKQHRTTLARVPVATFTCCLTLQQDTPENRQKVEAYTKAEHALVPPVSHGSFAGRLDYSRLSLMERGMMRMMKAPEGDYRDWKAIDAWARGLAAPFGCA